MPARLTLFLRFLMMLYFYINVIVSPDAVFCDSGCGEAAAGGGKYPRRPLTDLFLKHARDTGTKTVHGRRVSTLSYMHLEARVRCDTCSSTSTVLGSHMVEFFALFVRGSFKLEQKQNDIASR